MSTGVRAPDALSAGSREQFTPGALWQSSFGTQPFHTGRVLLPAPGSLGFSVLARTPALIPERSVTTQTDPLPTGCARRDFEPGPRGYPHDRSLFCVPT